MEMQILKDSGELGERDYREISKGVYIVEDDNERRVVILEEDDTGVLLTVQD